MTVPASGRLRLTTANGGAAVQRARRLLDRYHCADDVTALDRALRGEGPPAVVVVGEVKRGKSTLVNALAGVDVRPTGEQVVTTGVLAVVPPAPSLPAGRARVHYADRHEDVALEAAAALLAADAARHDGRERPVSVRAAWPSPWVPGLALVDTPGTGGLVAAHARLAREAAASATALLFVVDGGQPLTAPELDVLRELAERTEHVVVVLTKTDRNPGGWETVLAEDRALLSRHVPRLAAVPILPVSAAYAVHARTLAAAAGPSAADTVAALVDASGLAALAATLRGMLADRQQAAVANALRAAHSGLERLERRVELEVRATDEVAVRDDLEAEHRRLRDLQLQQRRGKLDLERDLGRIRQSALDLLTRRAEDVTTRMSRRIQQEFRGGSQAARDRFATELEAELTFLAQDVRGHVADGVRRLVEAAFGSLDAVPDTSGRVSADLADVRMRVRTRERTAMNAALDPALAGNVFMGSHLAGLFGMGGPVGLLVGGGAMVAVNVLHRSARQGQQELAGTLQDSVAGARADLTAAVDAWLRELRPELHLALEDHVTRSLAAVRGVLAQAQRAAQADEAARAERRERLRLRLNAVSSRRAAIAAQLDDLAREHRALPAPPTGQPTTRRDP